MKIIDCITPIHSDEKIQYVVALPNEELVIDLLVKIFLAIDFLFCS